MFCSEGIPRNDAAFGRGRGRIWMDGVNCRGNETSLEHCQFNGWGIHDCDHGEDVGVECTNSSTNLTSVAGKKGIYGDC